MGTFSKLVLGRRVRKLAKLPLAGARYDIDRGDWEGPSAAVALVAITEAEYGDALGKARKYAQERGVANPEPGDDLYERGLMIHTLAAACIDPDSPEDAPQPFFDGGAAQILASDTLTPEIVGYLYGLQQQHQDEHNPLVKDLSPAEFMAAVIKTAGGDPSFFVSSRPGTQWSFVRTLASLRVASMMHESPSSGFTDAAPPTNL